MKNIIVLLILYSHLFQLISCKCRQPKINNSLCYCDNRRIKTLHCENLTDEDTLSVFSPFEISVFDTIQLSNVSLTVIPGDDITFSAVRTIHVTNSNLDFLFAHVPSKLNTLILDNVLFENGMFWDYFEDVHNLETLLIRGVEVSLNDTEFEMYVSRRLKILMLKNTHTTHLVDGIFKNFVYLNDVRIESAKIKKLKRNMFPRPAEVLEILSFEDNKISYLPKDLFSDMPSLKNVDFSDNYLKEVPISLFGVIKRIQFLSLEGNPLQCNCNMRWIVWKGLTWSDAFERQIEGICKGPSDVSGVELRDLTVFDFQDCTSFDYPKFLKKTLEMHLQKENKIILSRVHENI